MRRGPGRGGAGVGARLGSRNVRWAGVAPWGTGRVGGGTTAAEARAGAGRVKGTVGGSTSEGSPPRRVGAWIHDRMGDRVVGWVCETAAETERVIVVEVIVIASVKATMGGVHFVVVVESAPEAKRVVIQKPH